MQYEAQRAFDQYNQVHPANRLVAQVLEQGMRKLSEYKLSGPVGRMDAAVEGTRMYSQGESLSGERSCPGEGPAPKAYIG